MTAQKKFSRLVRLIYELDHVAVAFSGGIKSSLLLCAAQEAHGRDVWALTVNAAFFTKEDLYCVHEVLEDYKLNDARIPVYVLQEQAVSRNGRERCEVCSGMMSAELARYAEQIGAEVLLDGCLKGGKSCIALQCTEKLECRSPFIELGYDIQDICDMLQAVGRGYYIRKPAGCLADRFAPEEYLTAEKLDFVEEAEVFIRKFAGKERRLYFTDWNVVVYTKKDLLEAEKESIGAELRKRGAKNVMFAPLQEDGEERCL